MKLRFVSSSNPPFRRRFHFHVFNTSQLPPLRTPKPIPIIPKPPSPPLRSNQPPPSPPPSPIHFDQKPSLPQFTPPSITPPLPPESSTPPFLDLFNSLSQTLEQKQNPDGKETNLVSVQYYEAKPGDLVVGVVLSGNESKLDISVGADMLGSMVARESLPFCKEETDWLVCEVNNKDFNGGQGKIGIVRDEEAFREKEGTERRSLEAGTVVFAEVLGRTLSGRPLLSGRRWFRQLAWHRVRQIMQLNEPIEVSIYEWNTGGLLTRIEGIRAFLPKTELVNRVNTFTDLKNNVGKRMHVHITRIDEATNVLIISARQAWDMTYLKPGTLLEGTVSKIFPYGAQIKLGDTNRSGLLHVSNISKERVTSVNNILNINEELKVLVIKSMYPDKIFLSTAELETEPGLFLSNKEKVYIEAEEMAKKYRKNSPDFSLVQNKKEDCLEPRGFKNDALLYSNWKWFKFEQTDEIGNNEIM